MKKHTLPRAIPATAAASLSFGAAACGGDDGPSGDGQALQSQLHAFSRSICESFMRCAAAEFTADFGDLDTCIRYYDDYYSDEYSALVLQQATDPAACESALVDLFDCYAGLYNSLSCGEIYCDSYSDPDCADEEWCDAEYMVVEADCDDPFSSTASGL